MTSKAFHFAVLLFHIILQLVDSTSEKPTSANLLLSKIDKLSEQHKAILMGFIQQDSDKHAALKAFLQLNFDEGFDKGFDSGYENRSAEHFLEMFGCAIQHGKTTLEAYKDHSTIFSKCESNRDAMLDIALPMDIKELIENHDEWIEVYELMKLCNGNFTTTTTTTVNPLSKKKSSVFRCAQTLFDITKQLRHWYCIVNYTGTDPETKSNKKSQNTKLTSITSMPMPRLISELREGLLEIQRLNPTIYETPHHIFLRFAALSGRTYKIFHTVHHKLLKHIEQTAYGNRTVQFSDILFYYVPKWLITTEQMMFFNLLHSINYPTFPPVKYFTIMNKDPKGSEMTLVPYDDSTHCNQVIIQKKEPTQTGTSVKLPPKHTKLFIS